MALLACAREAACGVTGVRIDTAFSLVRVARHGRLDVGHAHFDGDVYGSDWLLFTNGCFAEQRHNYYPRTTACAQHALGFNPTLQGCRRRVVVHSAIRAAIPAWSHASASWPWRSCAQAQARYRGFVAAIQIDSVPCGSIHLVAQACAAFPQKSIQGVDVVGRVKFLHE